jgi:WD40 repeat protein
VADAWVAAIHASADDYEPIGSGIVLDDRRILTCAHVAEATAALWVSFPKADGDAAEARRRVERVRYPRSRAPVKDLAILVLAEPVPAQVTPAPLRCPRPADLVGMNWWAFGFPAGDPVGSTAEGQVGGALAHGWVRLHKASADPVERGFSGGGLWSPDYQAVVAVVTQASGPSGDGRAITLHQADLWFPGQDLRALSERYMVTDAGELALAAWGWSLSGDSEGIRHWRPRARGVSIDSERGYRFRGRTTALHAITAWLGRHTIDRRVLVVTGAPGAGKSAVLGRIVTTADADAVRELPASDTALRAKVGSVACAVHAKGQTGLEVATRIAKAASAALPERIEDFAPALHSALTDRAGSRFNVIIDALDEAATPAEARTIISKVIVPLAETCADVGAQVVVGSRRFDGEGDLLAAFDGVARLVDLDRPEFFAEEDLAAYAYATLQLAGDERAGNPYAAGDVAAPVAERIAQLSDGNFLVAGLTARTHGLYDDAPADPAELSFSPRVDDAMREYLKRIPPVSSVSAETLLTALAFAESPGLPVSLWRAAVRALEPGDVTEAGLRKFARSSAASFLVESSGEDGAGAQFSLFHQALNDALLHARAKLVEASDDEAALTRAFLAAGEATGWDRAADYALRSLPGHAARAGLTDELLADDRYLLHADLLRVLQVADQATSATGHQRARLLRLSPRRVLTADAPNRASMLSVTEALEDLPRAYTRSVIPGPYRAAWAAVPSSPEHSVLRGHDGGVNAICAFTLNGTAHLATAGDDKTVRIWNPATGTHVRTFTGHDGRVTAICAFSLGGTTHLATVSNNRTIQIWSPATGTHLRTLSVRSWVRAICAFTLSGASYLAVVSDDRTIRIWDPATGTHIGTLSGHLGSVNGICAFTLGNGTTRLATASEDNTVRVWNPADGTYRTLTTHSTRLRAICALTRNSTTHLAVVSSAGDIQIWNPASGTQRRTLFVHGWVRAICAFTLSSGTTCLAVVSSDDGSVQIWDPVDGIPIRTLSGHDDSVSAICPVTFDGTTLLAVASKEETVRIWDPNAGATLRAITGHDGWVNGICAFTLGNGTTRLATASEDETVRIWNPADGTITRTLAGHHGWINAICAITLHDGTTHLATASDDQTVRIWNPADGTQVRTLAGHHGWINAICAITLRDGTTHLASVGDDQTARIWNLTDGTQIRALTGHEARVTAICSFSLGGTTCLATASDDQTARIWNLTDGTQVRTLAGHAQKINVVYPLTLGGAPHLVGADGDGTVLIWNLTDGSITRNLAGHDAAVTAICAFTLGGIPHLATASHDRTIRIWNPATDARALVVPTRDPCRSVASADGMLFVGTETGVLAIRLDTDFLRHSLR